MKTDNKGIYFFKFIFSILSISVIFIFISIFSRATASSYFEYTDCPPYDRAADCCGLSPPPPCITYIHVSSPHRYNVHSDTQMEEYGWVGDP